MNYVRAGTVLALLVFGFYLSANPPQTYVQGYGPGFSPEQQLLKAIHAELRGIREDMRAGGQLGPLSAGTPEAVIKNRCAKCHDASVAETEGNGYVMTRNGRMVKFRPDDKRRIDKKVKSNSMPPSGGLSESEKKLLYEIQVEEEK